MSNTQARTSRQVIDDANKHALTMPNENGWALRHVTTWNAAVGHTSLRAAASAIPRMLVAAADYADAHTKRFDSTIGFDYVLGEAFANVLQGIRTMLNGELGQLDAGTLDKMINEMALVNGINADTWELSYTPAEVRGNG